MAVCRWYGIQPSFHFKGRAKTSVFAASKSCWLWCIFESCDRKAAAEISATSFPPVNKSILGVWYTLSWRAFTMFITFSPSKASHSFAILLHSYGFNHNDALSERRSHVLLSSTRFHKQKILDFEEDSCSKESFVEMLYLSILEGHHGSSTNGRSARQSSHSESSVCG